jgi:hypothetical protein
MKLLTPLIIFSFLLTFSSCVGPKVNTCLFDWNVFDHAIDSLPEPLTKDGLKKALREAKPQYCVPPGAKDDSKDFHREMRTGDHVYDAFDWGILMNWIVDHRK